MPLNANRKWIKAERMQKKMTGQYSNSVGFLRTPVAMVERSGRIARRPEAQCSGFCEAPPSVLLVTPEDWRQASIPWAKLFAMVSIV